MFPDQFTQNVGIPRRYEPAMLALDEKDQIDRHESGLSALEQVCLDELMILEIEKGRVNFRAFAGHVAEVMFARDDVRVRGL
jgi:hypothetical protein